MLTLTITAWMCVGVAFCAGSYVGYQRGAADALRYCNARLRVRELRP